MDVSVLRANWRSACDVFPVTGSLLILCTDCSAVAGVRHEGRPNLACGHHAQFSHAYPASERSFTPMSVRHSSSSPCKRQPVVPRAAGHLHAYSPFRIPLPVFVYPALGVFGRDRTGAVAIAAGRRAS